MENDGKDFLSAVSPAPLFFGCFPNKDILKIEGLFIQTFSQ